MMAVKRIYAGDLDIAYHDAGPADGTPVLLLHGWPYDIHSFADIAKLLASRGFRVIVPYLRGFGATRFRDSTSARNGQQCVFALDAIALMNALRVPQVIVAGFDWGARTANIMAALWPDRCHALVSVSGYLIGDQQAGQRPLPPVAEMAWWYQFYFATDRGARGYAENRRPLAELIWRTASPQWRFTPQEFERSAVALDNPDHVTVVVDNYRWRLGLVQGDPKLDAIEARLAQAPAIRVPTITLEGDANGAPHPDPSTYAGKFQRGYLHRQVAGGIGHNLPQEAPDAFAQAVIDAPGL